MSVQKPRFDFGRNWKEFASTLREEDIRYAEDGLVRVAPNLGGERFLDIGSGSGLSSLAALRQGVKELEALDYDMNSVETTRAVLQRHWGSERWHARPGDILAENADDLGGAKFDTVYSWGVLHHTGDMWKAIRNAASFVDDGGRLVVALYIKTRICGF